VVVATLLAIGSTATAEPPASRLSIAHEARHGRSTTLPIDGDITAEVLLGPATSTVALIYLHGVCGDPFAFRSWARAARRYATFVSLRGDLGCDKRPKRRKWSWDLKRLDRRIVAAVTAASQWRVELGMAALDIEDIVVVGYSQGAHRAEYLASQFPERYRRVGLFATPERPGAGRLAKNLRVLLVAGAWDARKHIFEGYEAVKRRTAARYFELPKARHGQYGPAAPTVMDRALRWLVTGQTHANPGQTDATGTKAP
jgi:predicted esterase